MNVTVFRNATLILPDRVAAGEVVVAAGRIAAMRAAEVGGASGAGDAGTAVPADAVVIDLDGRYLGPGLIDLHVHGGDGADFMDGTVDAFRTVCRCHVRHGTTRLTPTSTVARRADYRRFLELSAALHNQDTGGARIVGAHLYGPYFARPARGCHPDQDFLVPDPANAAELLTWHEQVPLTVTIAPEVPQAEWLVRTYGLRGVRFNIGHSYATFEQVAAAVGWGVRHVDHLFCAMSDRARLRQTQPYPMRGGVLEATLYFDELTTEVIADGRHLAAELLRLAYKLKGPQRLAVVTDAMRAVDRPDGEYVFGPQEYGQRVYKRDGVGLMPDGSALASGVMGLDHGVRTLRAAGIPLAAAMRMASLTPATILGIDAEYGSLEAGKRADLVVWSPELTVEQVYIDGRRVV